MNPSLIPASYRLRQGSDSLKAGILGMQSRVARMRLRSDRLRQLLSRTKPIWLRLTHCLASLILGMWVAYLRLQLIRQRPSTNTQNGAGQSQNQTTTIKTASKGSKTKAPNYQTESTNSKASTGQLGSLTTNYQPIRPEGKIDTRHRQTSPTASKA